VTASGTTVAKGDAVPVYHEVLRQIYRDIGKLPAEHGGVLGGDPATGIVTRFWFDKEGDRSGGTYSPAITSVNKIIDEDWAKEKEPIRFLGFAHSHPHMCRRPSSGDERYVRAILEAKRSLGRLLVPIIMPETDGCAYELLFWVAERDGKNIRFRMLPVVAVDDAGNPVNVDATGLLVESKPVVPDRARAALADFQVATRDRTTVQLGGTFDRVVSAYDLGRMARSRLMFGGVGGMRKTVIQAARAGIEEFVLIDPGDYEAANIGTQPCFRDEVGIAKVEAIKVEILRVNPNARVIALKCPLDDLDDDAILNLLITPLLSVPVPGREGRTSIDICPEAVAIVGGTDDFFAQARVNRLGLKFGLPTMLSAVYQNGLGAELTWAHPGVSRSCHRCSLWCRYEAFLKEGYKNAVTSHGTPIFATQRLSALEMMMLMALLHHGTDHARLGKLLRRIGQRSLVQIRLDPDFSTSLGLKVFDRVFANADKDRLFCDETVWLPQAPEDGKNGRRACPECGGTGDLRTSLGCFKDTRIMPE